MTTYCSSSKAPALQIKCETEKPLSPECWHPCPPYPFPCASQWPSPCACRYQPCTGTTQEDDPEVFEKRLKGLKSRLLNVVTNISTLREQVYGTGNYIKSNLTPAQQEVQDLRDLIARIDNLDEVNFEVTQRAADCITLIQELDDCCPCTLKSKSVEKLKGELAKLGIERLQLDDRIQLLKRPKEEVKKVGKDVNEKMITTAACGPRGKGCPNY